MKASIGTQIGSVELVIAGAKTGGLNKIVARQSEREAILAGAQAALATLRWVQDNEAGIKQILEARSKGVA